MNDTSADRHRRDHRKKRIPIAHANSQSELAQEQLRRIPRSAPPRLPSRRVPVPSAARHGERLKKRRFAGSFRNRWKRLRRRVSARADIPASDPSKTTFPPTRKRTAALMSVSAIALTGASDLALMAEQAANPVPEVVEAEVLDPAMRRDVSELATSDAMVEALVEEEGVRYKVYRDVAGYPTVGVGHLVLPEDNLRVGERISHERAMRLLEQDLAKAEDGVRELVGELPLNQNEFDALVDLVFNVGIGNVSETESPRLNAAIRAGDYDAIAAELDYTTAAGRVARGLIHRSERRTKIFLSADYEDPRAA